jgi:hypothetical protein
MHHLLLWGCYCLVAKCATSNSSHDDSLDIIAHEDAQAAAAREVCVCVCAAALLRTCVCLVGCPTRQAGRHGSIDRCGGGRWRFGG